MKQRVGKGSVLAVVVVSARRNLVRPRNGVIETNVRRNSGYGIFGLRFGASFAWTHHQAFSSSSADKRDRVQSIVLYDSCRILMLKYVSLLVCLTCAAS
jgi:hypothetical protein